MTDQLQTYHDAFNDCWQLLKQYSTEGDPSDSDYWDSYIKAADDLANKYNLELVTKILLAISGELDRQSRELRRRAKE